MQRHRCKVTRGGQDGKCFATCVACRTAKCDSNCMVQLQNPVKTMEEMKQLPLSQSDIRSRHGNEHSRGVTKKAHLIDAPTPYASSRTPPAQDVDNLGHLCITS